MDLAAEQKRRREVAALAVPALVEERRQQTVFAASQRCPAFVPKIPCSKDWTARALTHARLRAPDPCARCRYACVAFVAGLGGRIGVSWLLKKTGLVSVVVVILGVLITGAFFMTIYVAGYRIILELLADTPLTFKSPCE